MTTPDSTARDTLLPYMRDVERCEQSLRELSIMWRTIESSAKMNCPAEARSILPAMAATRRGFAAFETALIESLAREKAATVLAELAAKAASIIDVIVRNLYERTADIGFLATDRQLCEFMAGVGGTRRAIQQRLQSYRAKYTVYEEIMLLALDGTVVAQADDGHTVPCSSDPLLAATLATDSYVETFRTSDLRPGQRTALIYSRRMHHPESGAVIGVLCLCFAFDNELCGIFRNYGGDERTTILLLLDGNNRVIASADPLWIPPGAALPVNRDGAATPVIWAGRAYLTQTVASGGYQGYAGPPGWQAQAMIPLDVAFAGTGANSVPVDPALGAGLLGHADVFCPPLAAILAATTMIRRVVWNVQVMTAVDGMDTARLDHILEQIGDTGRRSDDLFARSIRDLLGTALTSSLRGVEAASRLLVDIMDRNLYERANDCRWWALASELRTLLAHGTPGREQDIQRILLHLNGLYTVYSSIFVYGCDGAVVAASAEGAFPDVDAATLASVAALRSEQAYHVSPFASSPYYDGRPTYVYHAAIRDAYDHTFVGGIGLVFDAQAEFQAMLESALGGRSGLHACFVDGDGIVVAATDPAHETGTRLDVEPALLASVHGTSRTGAFVHDGQYAVLGSTMSHGYREFKNTDGYRCDIVAVVIETFGTAQQENHAAQVMMPAGLTGGARSGMAFATFLIGGERFALPATDVCEAVPANRVVPVSMGGWDGRRGVLALDDDSDEPHYVWVFDSANLLRGTQPARAGAAAEVLVLRHAGCTLGLQVDALHSVVKYDEADIVPNPAGAGSQLVCQVIMADGGATLIQLLDTRSLFALLTQPQAA